jgi:hypothetical protein
MFGRKRMRRYQRTIPTRRYWLLRTKMVVMVKVRREMMMITM